MKSGFLSTELENLNNCLKRTWIEEGKKKGWRKGKKEGRKCGGNEEGRKENSLSKSRLYFSRATFVLSNIQSVNTEISASGNPFGLE